MLLFRSYLSKAEQDGYLVDKLSEAKFLSKSEYSSCQELRLRKN